MEEKRVSKFTVIDLFSGVGGLSKGFLDEENINIFKKINEWGIEW